MADVVSSEQVETRATRLPQAEQQKLAYKLLGQSATSRGPARRGRQRERQLRRES